MELRPGWFYAYVLPAQTINNAQKVLIMQTGTGFLKIGATFVAGAIAAAGLGAYLYFSRTPDLTISIRMKRVAGALALGGLGLALLSGTLWGWELLVCTAPAIAFVVLGVTGGTYLNLRLRQWCQLQQRCRRDGHRQSGELGK